jgi:hypothetical protein
MAKNVGIRAIENIVAGTDPASCHLRQTVVHPIHGPGKIAALDKGVATIVFDNDKERPIRISLRFNALKLIKDF